MLADSASERLRLGSQTAVVRPNASYVVSVRRRLGSTSSVGCPQAGANVVVVTCPSALVTTVLVNGPPVAGVYAVLVSFPSASLLLVTRPCTSNTAVAVAT